MKKQNFKMDHELEERENIPDYLNWYLKSRGLTLDMIRKSVEKLDPIYESPHVLKSRELEQTQKLVVSLIDVLFKKIEENKQTVDETKTGIAPKKIEVNPIKVKEEVYNEKTKQFEEKPKFEFSDISWYKKFLDANQEEEFTPK